MAIVRTEAGSARFDKPIGSPLQENSPLAAAPAPVSPVRLRSLRLMIMAKMAIGDSAAVRALTEKFRAEYNQFSAGKSPQEVDQALRQDA